MLFKNRVKNLILIGISYDMNGDDMLFIMLFISVIQNGKFN